MTVRRLRVILRLVWRAERADWRSSVFSVALLALAIAVGFVTIVAARSLSDEGYQWVGYAGDAQATVEFSDDPGVREAVEERFGPPDALRETFFLRGTADRGHTIVVILDGTTLGASAFPLMAGRLPGAGEAAINRADDRFADVSIGDEVAAMVGVDGSLEVVGVFNSTHASATVLVAESSGRVDWNADFVRIVLLYSDVTADFKQLPDWSVVHVGPATAVLRHYLPASATSEIDRQWHHRLRRRADDRSGDCVRSADPGAAAPGCAIGRRPAASSGGDAANWQTLCLDPGRSDDDGRRRRIDSPIHGHGVFVESSSRFRGVVVGAGSWRCRDHCDRRDCSRIRHWRRSAPGSGRPAVMFSGRFVSGDSANYH